MKDRQKIFLDRVVKLIVDDTGIYYDRKEINFPYIINYNSSLPYNKLIHTSFSLFPLVPYSPFSFLFSDYCKNTFGLTKEEIKYVWDEYISIINDKIKNNER